MNIELYVIMLLGGLFLVTVISIIFAQRSWIRQQRQFLLDSYATIEKLQDRIMAKSFDQYKMYEQIKESPKTLPILTELDDGFNEEAVGKITGEEIGSNA